MARLVSPTRCNGLKVKSEIMIDKLTALRRERIQERMGNLTPKLMHQCEEALRRMLEI